MTSPDPITTRLGDLTRIQSQLAGLPPHLYDGVFSGLFGIHDNGAIIQGLYDAVGAALDVLPPPGSPGSLRALAGECGSAAGQCSAVAVGLRSVAAAQLPAAWAGAAADLAAGTVGALSAQAATIASVLEGAADALWAWADGLSAWQDADQRAVKVLGSAWSQMTLEGRWQAYYPKLLSPYEDVLSAARKGVAARIEAAGAAQQAASRMDVLKDLAARLRAAQEAHGDVTPLAAVVKAAALYSGTPAGG